MYQVLPGATRADQATARAQPSGLARAATDTAALTGAILDVALDCVVVIDGRGHVLEWNPAAERTFGYEREEAVGRSLGELIVPPELQEAHRKGLARYLATGESHVLGRRIELPAIRADDTRLTVELTITQVPGEQTLFAGYLRDITERRRSEDLLQEAERQYRTLVERLPVVVYVAGYGAKGRWRYVSPQIEELLGYTPAEWLADPELWLACVHPNDRDRVVAQEERCARERVPLESEYRMVARDGDIVWVRDEASVGRSLPDGSVEIEGLLIDITEQRRADDELRYRADHDQLTGLFNRRRFEEELDRCRSRADPVEGAVVVIDIDHLKLVNDSLGHAAGDAVVSRIAQTLGRQLADGEVLARLGGDEFALLLAGTGERAARERALALVDSVRSQDTRMPVTASAGVALFASGGRSTSEDMLVAADIALYEAKDQGRDRVVLFSGREGDRLAWVGRIRSAIEEERLTVHSQPIVELATGQTVSEELLVRMTDQGGELVLPGSFLPTAERFGLVREIDRWVVRQALRIAARGRTVNVNLSARSVSDPDLPLFVENELATSGADPARIVFEITETAAASQVNDLSTFAERFQRLGCGLALDDFGTGFGSLSYLKHLSPRYLKIDMEFVRGAARSEADERILASIVAFARSLGMSTVAEGVEDAETLAVLGGHGVQYAQGYYLGRPAPLQQA